MDNIFRTLDCFFFVASGVWKKYKTYDSNFKGGQKIISQNGLTNNRYRLLFLGPKRKIWKIHGSIFEYEKDFTNIISTLYFGINLKRGINFIDFATMEIRVEYEEMFEP